MSVKEIEKLDDQGVQAWGKHDPDALVSLFAERFEWSDDTQPQPMHSKEDVRRYIQSWLNAFPDMQVKTINRVVSDDAVGAEVEFTGTNRGPLEIGGRQVPATNKKVKAHVAYFAKVKDNKIVEYHSHPNMMEMMSQLGISQM
jgi:steroid delta-isomerase-like uncharacterized protein